MWQVGVGRQGGEGKPATQPARHAGGARPPLPRCSARCQQGQPTLCTQERLNEGLCCSLGLLSHYGHEGKSLKPPQLCSSASHSSRAMTEPTGNAPYGSSPWHKPASPQWSSAGGAQAVPALRLPCSRSAGHAAPHSSRRAATASHVEHIQQTFLCTLRPQHLTEPNQRSLPPGAHPPANFCPCKPCRVCPSAQHLSSGVRTPHLRDHSQCLPSDSSQPNPSSGLG